MRVIDADLLTKEIYQQLSIDDYLKFVEFIKKAPTVDAVPVVRCEDCEYFTSISKYSINGSCYLSDDLWKPNDYCCYGKYKKGK